MAIRNADTAGREETCQPTFGAPSPTDPLPFPSGQQRFSSNRGLIRDVVFAGLSDLRDGEDQGNVGGVNVLASRHAHRPTQAALPQSPTESPAERITLSGKHTAETCTGGDDAVDLLDRNFRLCQSSLSILRHTGPRHALRIICPTLGQE